jgi:3-dehydroquinate synthase
MKYINSSGCSLEIGSLMDSSLLSLLVAEYAKSKKVIIVDDNTHEKCLGYLITNFEVLSDAEVIRLPIGEENKQLSITYGAWEALTEYEIDRRDVIINLGGGVITDMGGFIASCYKRGCDYINIPTTLLGMVDASIGGKIGVNLGHYKNQIGLFSNPVKSYIDFSFLKTLPDVELKSGYAEMLKHGLISEKKLFFDVLDQMNNDFHSFNVDLMISCIEVKNKIVSEDPLEDGKRKILNFGHTIGHAIEGCFMSKKVLTHGHSIAIGMVMESFLSVKHGSLSLENYTTIEKSILSNYPIPKFTDSDIQQMIEMMKNDKKNRQGKILCCLLEDFGSCSYDNEINPKDFVEVFLHFKNLQINLN